MKKYFFFQSFPFFKKEILWKEKYFFEKQFLDFKIQNFEAFYENFTFNVFILN